MKTPEAQTDSLRTYLLEANPNPERIDCPPESVIQAAAENRVGADHPVRLHLASCSECFAEFRGYKLDWEARRGTRLQAIGWATAAAVVIAIVGGVIAMNHAKTSQGPPEQIVRSTPPPLPFPPDNTIPQKPPSEHPVGVEPITKTDPTPQHPPTPPDHQVGVPPHTGDKGPDEPTQYPSHEDPTGPATPIGELPSATFDLTNLSGIPSGPRTREVVLGLRARTTSVTLLLPNTAEPGPYEVRIAKDKSGDDDVENAHGEASRTEGKLILKVLLSLGDCDPGDYFLVTIHEGNRSTRSYPVHVD